MTAQPKKQGPQRPDRDAPEPAGKPSQAEGDRDTIEQALGERAPRRAQRASSERQAKPGRRRPRHDRASSW
jgi:hypothetical protein